MDVDLATGLDALLPLVAPLLSGHSDVAIGTRLGPGAHVVRGVRRELISRAYNLLLRIALGSRCTDAQCGFKAMRRPVAAELLPLVEDDEWFFDTEMLVTAQRNGLRIHEVPVDWVDDLDSRVEVTRTAWKDLRGVLRMLGPTARRRSGRASTRAATVERTGPARGWGRRSPSPVAPPSEGWTRSKARSGWRAGAEVEGGDSTAPVFSDELLRFAGVGAVSTVAYAVLFASLQPSMGSYLANAVAIVLCGVGNTAAHRGMAGMAGPRGDRRHRRTAAAVLLGVSLTFTTGALAVMRAAGLSSLGPELCAVTVANIGAAFIRFGILRTWVFRPEFGTHLAPAATTAGGGAASGSPSSARMA
jgi:putative flippase GtrA